MFGTPPRCSTLLLQLHIVKGQNHECCKTAFQYVSECSTKALLIISYCKLESLDEGLLLN